MKIEEISEKIEGKVVCGEHRLGEEITCGFSSDLMSDVLTTGSEKLILITGLSNVQLIRTAEMSDISYIVMARGKKVSDEMLNLARENDMVLIETSYSMFRTSGVLFSAGIQPLF
ncbi:MAG: hypothetical protein K9I74_10130 [Bacteroidales bacterium]|nr:hypothetical protein [Bacteroidales bacterium]